MPPLKTFIFDCISDAQTTITIYAYEEISAIWRMKQHVKDPDNWKLRKE